MLGSHFFAHPSLSHVFQTVGRGAADIVTGGLAEIPTGGGLTLGEQTGVSEAVSTVVTGGAAPLPGPVPTTAAQIVGTIGSLGAGAASLIESFGSRAAVAVEGAEASLGESTALGRAAESFPQVRAGATSEAARLGLTGTRVGVAEGVGLAATVPTTLPLSADALASPLGFTRFLEDPLGWGKDALGTLADTIGVAALVKSEPGKGGSSLSDFFSTVAGSANPLSPSAPPSLPGLPPASYGGGGTIILERSGSPISASPWPWLIGLGALALLAFGIVHAQR